MCKIETAVINILNGITYHVSHIPTGPRGKCTLGNSYLQFVSEFDREAAFAKLIGKVSIKNSKGEIVKFERARTKTQKTRNYYLFSAFDKRRKRSGRRMSLSIQSCQSVQLPSKMWRFSSSLNTSLSAISWAQLPIGNSKTSQAIRFRRSLPASLKNVAAFSGPGVAWFILVAREV